MATQIERSNATRAKILSVGRAVFVRKGYDETSVEEIATEAGLTKGALYHHYKGKESLFAALFCLVSQETIDAAGRLATKKGGPRENLKSAAIAWLKVAENSDARVILLELGPKALGFARMRALEDSITLKPLLVLVSTVVEAEDLPGREDVLLAARLINAALTEIALMRHASDGRLPSAAKAGLAIAGVIDGVLKRSD